MARKRAKATQHSAVQRELRTPKYQMDPDDVPDVEREKMSSSPVEDQKKQLKNDLF